MTQTWRSSRLAVVVPSHKRINNWCSNFRFGLKLGTGNANRTTRARTNQNIIIICTMVHHHLTFFFYYVLCKSGTRIGSLGLDQQTARSRIRSVAAVVRYWPPWLTDTALSSPRMQRMTSRSVRHSNLGCKLSERHSQRLVAPPGPTPGPASMSQACCIWQGRRRYKFFNFFSFLFFFGLIFFFLIYQLHTHTHTHTLLRPHPNALPHAATMHACMHARPVPGGYLIRFKRYFRHERDHK